MAAQERHRSLTSRSIGAVRSSLGWRLVVVALICLGNLMLSKAAQPVQAQQVPIDGAAPAGAAVPCRSSIELGVALLCTIDAQAEVDTFTVEGNVDDVLLLRANRVSNTVQPWIRVINPDGVQVCEGFAERFVEIGCVLKRSGVFTIRVADSSAARDKTGAYRLYVQRLNNAGAASPVSYGVRIAETIEESSEIDSYTIDGLVDDTLLLRITRVSETVQPWVRVYGTTGQKACEGFAERFVEIGCKLPATGRYTLLVSDATALRTEIGAYSLQVQRLNRPGAATAIAFGQTRTSRLDLPGQLATYIFTGTVDDVIFLRAYRTTDELQPWVRIFSPTGVLVCEQHTISLIEFTCKLASSGQYTIILSDRTALRELTGGYDLYLQRLNNPGLVTTLGEYGQSIYESVDTPARVDTFVIDGQVDDRLLIRMRRLSDTMHPWLRMYDATGRLVCEGFAERFFEIACTLPRGGRYTILVADATAGRVETGAYSLYLQRLNNPGSTSPIAPGTSAEGLIQIPGAVDTYRFQGEVGARITLRMLRTSDTLNPWIRVFDPRGAFICESFNPTQAEIGNCELPRTGAYTVIVGDATAARSETGSYSLSMDCLAVGCAVSAPPPCGVGANGLDTCALEPGDILLQRWNSLFNNVFMTLGGTYFTHAAMYVGEGRVVEALGPHVDPDDQVIEHSVASWTNPAIYDWVVIRPSAGDEVREAAVTYMRAMAADPAVTYSLLAEKESDTTVYCSQLVWRAYQRSGVNLEVDRGGSLTDIASLNRLVTPDDLFYSAGLLAQRSIIVQQRSGSTDRNIWRWSMWILSPAHLLLVDDEGRRTGFDAATGTVLDEIPGVVYSGPEAAVETISVTDPTGMSAQWTLYVVGYSSGAYTIEAGSVDSSTPPGPVHTGTTQAGKVEQFIINDPGTSGAIDVLPAEPQRSFVSLPLLRR